jgi:hypothetical protein
MKKIALVLGMAAAMAGCQTAGPRWHSVTVRPEKNEPFQSYAPVTVKLPPAKQYAANSTDEKLYEKGYATGYMDEVRGHMRARNSVGDAAKIAWIDGWSDGYKAAGEARGKTAGQSR